MGRGDETNKGDNSIRKDESRGVCFIQQAWHGAGRTGDAHLEHTFGCERRSRSAASAAAPCSRAARRSSSRAGIGARPPDAGASSSDGQALPSEGRRKAAKTLKNIALQLQFQFLTNLSKGRLCDLLVKPYEFCGRSCSFLLCNTSRKMSLFKVTTRTLPAMKRPV